MAGNLHTLRDLLTPRPGVGSRPQGARGARRALGLLALVALHARPAHAASLVDACEPVVGTRPGIVVDVEGIPGMEQSGAGLVDSDAIKLARAALLRAVSLVDTQGRPAALRAARWNGRVWMLRPASPLRPDETYTFHLPGEAAPSCIMHVTADSPGGPPVWLGGDAAWIGRPRGAHEALYVMIATPEGATTSKLWLDMWKILPEDDGTADHRGPDEEFPIPRTTDGSLFFRTRNVVSGHRHQTVRFRVRNVNWEFSSTCFDIEMFAPSRRTDRPILFEVAALNPIDRFVVGYFAADLAPGAETVPGEDPPKVYGSKSGLGMPLRPTSCPDNGDPRPPGLVFE